MATSAGCDSDKTLHVLTDFVRQGGIELEQQWIDEHRPDALKRKCLGCGKVCTDGKCYFYRAAHRARRLRTLTLRMRRDRECDEPEE